MPAAGSRKKASLVKSTRGAIVIPALGSLLQSAHYPTNSRPIRGACARRCSMVQLADSDIRTREVLGWRGVHVLHFVGSSCSQKLRVFLNLKKIPWQSHPVDLPS